MADLLKRDFTATAPNLRYVGDITYLPFDGGDLYLATVIDCHSRRLVGWSIADHMRTDLVSDALRDAARQRGSLRGAVFFSDPGAQYGAKDYAQLCRELVMSPDPWARSAAAPTTPWPSRSTPPSSERPCRAPRAGTPPRQARLAVFIWITRYNTRRRHSYCGHLSPSTYEKTSTAATLQPAA